MSGKRESYTPAYRREAARLVIDTGPPIATVARDHHFGEQLLGRWVALERSRMDTLPAAVDADERAELERFRAENAELRLDREFPKKSGGLLRSRTPEPVDAFAVIMAEKATYGVTRGCRLLGGVPVGLLRLGGPGNRRPERGADPPGSLDGYGSINAAADAFWSTLETEFCDRQTWPTKTTARQAVEPGSRTAATGNAGTAASGPSAPKAMNTNSRRHKPPDPRVHHPG